VLCYRNSVAKRFFNDGSRFARQQQQFTLQPVQFRLIETDSIALSGSYSFLGERQSFAMLSANPKRSDQ
jgi:hypothetical protein